MLLDFPATGVFEREHSNEWEEYCYHVDDGPPELDFAFEVLIDPLTGDLARMLSTSEAVLLTTARYWATDQLSDGPNRHIG